MLCNITRTHDYMRRYNLDVLVATSPVAINYFADYYCWLDHLSKIYMSVPGGSSDFAQNYVIFPLQGDPTLVVNPLFAVNASGTWVRDIATFGASGLDYALSAANAVEADPFLGALEAGQRHRTSTEVLLETLRARGLTNARIGLEMESLPAQTKATIVAAFPQAEIKDCTNLMRLIRMVKSQEEIARLARAAEINAQAARESLAQARPGSSTSEITQAYRERIAALGADFDHFAFGVHGRGIMTEGGSTLKHGDILYTDFGCMYQQYFSDSGITLAFDELPPELATRQAALQDTIQAGMQMLRPHVKASAVQAAMFQELNRRHMTMSFPHGHGLGLELRDYPILVPDNGLRIRDDCVDVPSDLPLEVDMVLNLEAALFMPDRGSLQVEQSFVVTPEGCRPLIADNDLAPIIAQ